MKLNCFGILAAGLLCASALSATPYGTMSLGIVVGGGVNVQGTRIDFFPSTNLPPNSPGDGLFATGSPTGIFYNNGTTDTILTDVTDPFGRISDLDSTPIFPSLGLNFIQFTGTVEGGAVIAGRPVFDITGVGPVLPATLGCVGVAAGVRCRPALSGGGFSPIVLTYNGTNTDVSLSVTLLGKDATGMLDWTGGFTSQVPGTPQSNEELIQGGGIITNTWSFTATGVPEPGTISMLGSGLMLFGLAAWRKRK